MREALGPGGRSVVSRTIKRHPDGALAGPGAVEVALSVGVPGTLLSDPAAPGAPPWRSPGRCRQPTPGRAPSLSKRHHSGKRGCGRQGDKRGPETSLPVGLRH